MKAVLRILQVEDSETDAALILRLFQNAEYEVHSERVEDSDEMRAALVRQEWGVVIADYSLPRFDAPAALRILQECGQDIPFLVVSGTVGEDRAVEMMRAGAHDYILKDNLSRLIPAVQREIREAHSRREHRRADEQLRDGSELLSLAVSVTQLGIFVYYPASAKTVWSETGKRHLGLPPDAVISYQRFLQGIHPDDRERIDGLVSKSLDPSSSGEFTTEYRTIGLEDQVERWLSARGRGFFDSDGNPVRFIGVTTDITEGKRLKDQFLQAQKLESLGLLAGGVAHDFNNLLTVINGYSQITLDALMLDDPLRSGVEVILKAGTRATFLTRQLLAFSRRRPNRPQTIVLNDVVAETRKMLERLIGDDVDLIISPDPAAGTIHADPGHIEQVIMNLVVNAKDAMPNGGSLVIETAHLVVDKRFAESHLDVLPGPYAVLTVSDTGSGMSLEVKKHLFEPFFTTKEQGKGTGLGLSTVYGIVKQCGGSISVYSEIGHGAKFRILLPTFAVEPAEGPSAPPATLARGTETILLAEDEPGVRMFVRAALEQQGYRVLECSNGREAIELARQHPGPIHLLLADAIMPKMGGVDLAALFSVCRPGVPVLCMSGYIEMVWPSGEASETSFIQKPFTATAVLAQVRALLDAAARPIPA